MSYSLAFFTVPVDDLTARLTAWLAAQGPADTAEAVAQQAVYLLRELGSPVDVVSHSSAGGAWFRERFFAEDVGGVIGAKTAWHLIDRSLAGTTWSGYPSMGWLTRSELAGAVRALDEAEPELEPESEELLELVSEILHMAAATNQDLVTVYS
jgi:hypothetical protein